MLVMALIACLEVLLQLSQANTGFTLSNLPRIVLAYTPVAIVIFVGWIWQVLDLEVKKMQPWIALSAGPVAAEDSLLLDYVGAGPLDLVRQALRSRHWRVLLTTLGLWIANAATVAASSMWFIEVTPRADPISMVQTSMFDGSIAHSSMDDVNFVHTYLGHVTFGLSLPQWISDDYVLASFNSSRPKEDALLRTTTDGYTADLSCVRGDVELAGYVSLPDYYGVFGPRNSMVNLPHVRVVIDQCSQVFNITSMTKIGLDSSGIANCKLDVSVTTLPQTNVRDPLDKAPWRNQTPYFFGGVYNMTCGVAPVTVLLMTHFVGEDMLNSTAIGCQPRYTRRNIEATVNATTAQLTSAFLMGDEFEDISYAGSDGTLSFIDKMLADWSSRSDALLDWFPGGNSKAFPPHVGVSYSPWFYLMAYTQDLAPYSLSDPHQLENAARTVFRDVWCHYAQAASLLLPSSKPYEGNAITYASRSFVRETSVRLLQSSLVLLALAIIAVVMTLPRTPLARDPSSLASVCTILSSSPDLETILQSTGWMSDENLRRRLVGYTAYLLVGYDGQTSVAINSQKAVSRLLSMYGSYDLMLKMCQDKIQPVNIASGEEEDPQRWRPAILSPLATTALLALILILMILMEILHQVSITRNGLFDNPAVFERFLWASLFPVLLAAFGLCMQAFDGAVRAVELLTAFSHNVKPASQFVTYNPLAHTTLTAVWHALSHGQSVGMLSAVSVLILPVVKIIIAGLFVETAAVNISKAPTLVTSAFNTSLNFNSSDARWILDQKMYNNPGPLVSLNQLSQYGLPTPNWTTVDYAIGEADLSGIPLHGADATVTVRLPVLYPEASNCTFLTTEEYTVLTSTVGDPQLTCSVPYDLSTGQKSVILTLPKEPGYFGILAPPCGQTKGFQVISGKTANGTEGIEQLIIGQCIANMIR
jgi:hypothetical protein